jgi:hypothetical protein
MSFAVFGMTLTVMLPPFGNARLVKINLLLREHPRLMLMETTSLFAPSASGHSAMEKNAACCRVFTYFTGHASIR